MRLTILLSLFIILQIIPVHSQSKENGKIYKGEFFMGFDGWGMAEKIFVPGKYTIAGKAGWLYRQNFQLIGETGYMNFSKMVSDTLKSYNYQSNSLYFRMGYDYNIFKRNALHERNFILLGVHAGYAITKHKADNILISDKIWGARTFSFPYNTSKHLWIDVSVNIRTQLLQHLALGWEITLSRIINTQNTQLYVPYFVGGYGKSKDKFSLGFHYYLFFTFGY